MIFETKQQTMTPWLMPFSKVRNGRLRLIFFPHAGGGASAFTQWSQILAPYIDCYAIQLPGRETRFREPLFQEIRPLINTLTEQLDSILDDPFIFWGHSMGALLSFEVARQLQKQGLPTPQQLIVSGYNAPHIPYDDPHIHHLSQADFIAALQTLNGTSPEVFQNHELRNLVLPIIRADFKLVETYAYQEGTPLKCPITVLDGIDDEKTNETDLQAWQKQTTLPLQKFTFSGDHFFLYDHSSQLIQQLIKIVFNHQIRSVQG